MITEINRSNAGLTEIESEYIAKNLLINVPVLSPVHTNEDVVTAFTMHENVIGLPVIENNRPIGLINRNIFMTYAVNQRVERVKPPAIFYSIAA